MKRIGFAFGLTLLLIAPSVQAQAPADVQTINRLIDEYSRLEDAGDMQGQAKLMSEDRIWIAQDSGRRTDQGLNMKIQQASLDALKAAFPDVKWFTEARDRLVKFYGNGAVAVASFYWYRGYVAPLTLPTEKIKVLGPQPVPMAVTLVLEKRGGNWVIVHTHSSDLTPPVTPN
jgi:ketosteroid isomerase-like protein